MSNNSINKFFNIKSQTNLGNLLDTSIWLITNDQVNIQSDNKPIISFIDKISLYEAIYVMVLNNVKVIKVNNINMLEPLSNINLNKLKIPTSSRLVTKDNFKKFFKNCHEFINEKTYVLNSKRLDENKFPELINSNVRMTTGLDTLSGGGNITSEIIAILNTFKINNMSGGKLSYYSNPNETRNLLRTIEQNFSIDANQKNRLETLIRKHAVYTDKLNKLNDNLNKFNNINDPKIKMDNIPNAVRDFKKIIEKNRKNNNNIINTIEDALGLNKSKKKSNMSMELRNYPFYHLDKIILNKFSKVEDQQKQKIITSQFDDLEAIERLVDNLTDTVDSTLKRM